MGTMLNTHPASPTTLTTFSAHTSCFTRPDFVSFLCLFCLYHGGLISPLFPVLHWKNSEKSHWKNAGTNLHFPATLLNQSTYIPSSSSLCPGDGKFLLLQASLSKAFYHKSPYLCKGFSFGHSFLPLAINSLFNKLITFHISTMPPAS